jgi:hypothetical protein
VKSLVFEKIVKYIYRTSIYDEPFIYDEDKGKKVAEYIFETYPESLEREETPFTLVKVEERNPYLTEKEGDADENENVGVDEDVKKHTSILESKYELRNPESAI